MRAIMCQIDAIVEFALRASRQGNFCRHNLQRLSDFFEHAALQMREELERRGPSFTNDGGDYREDMFG